MGLNLLCIVMGAPRMPPSSLSLKPACESGISTWADDVKPPDEDKEGQQEHSCPQTAFSRHTTCSVFFFFAFKEIVSKLLLASWAPPPFSYKICNFETHLAYECVCPKSLLSCPTLCNPMDCGRSGLSVHGFPKQEYWSGFLPQGIFLTQESNLRLLCLLHWQAGSLPLAPPGKPIWHIDLMKWSINIAKKTKKKAYHFCINLKLGYPITSIRWWGRTDLNQACQVFLGVACNVLGGFLEGARNHS